MRSQKADLAWHAVGDIFSAHEDPQKAASKSVQKIMVYFGLHNPPWLGNAERIDGFILLILDKPTNRTFNVRLLDILSFQEDIRDCLWDSIRWIYS
jgi:hypothetical protein